MKSLINRACFKQLGYSTLQTYTCILLSSPNGNKIEPIGKIALDLNIRKPPGKTHFHNVQMFNPLSNART